MCRGYHDATHLRRHRLVDRAPPDVVLGAVLLHNALVGRRTASLSTRVRGEGACGCDGGTGLVDERILVQGGNGRVGDLETVLVWLAWGGYQV